VKRLLAEAAATAVLLVPAQAWAAEPATSQPASGYYTIEVGEERQRSGEPAGVSRARTLAETGLSAAACKRVWAARVYRNVFGVVLWKYYQQQAFCYNGARITSLYDWRRWPVVNSPGWDFRGHIGRARTGGAGTWHYGTWTQGHFAFCTAWCAAHLYPWVDIDVYGNGGWSHRTGGT
jgi:hypothetical protein